MNKILVSRLGKGAGLTAHERYTIKRAAAAVLELEGCPRSQVAVLYTNDEEMRKLNLRTRGIDNTTDVLSFPNIEVRRGEAIVAGPGDMDEGCVVLGDIVLSVDRAREQASQYGHSIEREFAFLTIHAMLHLLGYDHERSKAEESAQLIRQNELLEAIGLPR